MKPKEKYKFKKYSKKYPLLFQKEKTKLKKILPKDAIIEHCGSSAVPGLGGKGMIDIFISVKKSEILHTKRNLRKNKYLYKPNNAKEREYFEKEYKYAKKQRKVHLHLTSHNNFEIKRAIAFRDYLTKNPKAKKEYTEIKKKASRYARGKGKKYREYKNKTLQKLGKEALKQIKWNPKFKFKIPSKKILAEVVFNLRNFFPEDNRSERTNPRIYIKFPNQKDYKLKWTRINLIGQNPGRKYLNSIL